MVSDVTVDINTNGANVTVFIQVVKFGRYSYIATHTYSQAYLYIYQ